MQNASYAEYIHARNLTDANYPARFAENNEIATSATINTVAIGVYPHFIVSKNHANGILTLLADDQICNHDFPATTISHPFNNVFKTILGIETTKNVNLSIRRASPIFKDSIIAKFRALSTEWKSSRNLVTSSTEMFMHPAYQKIIGMGQTAVPLIFNELEKNIDHWFWALKAITEADPVPPNHRGRLGLMTKDWIFWAKAQGYEW